MHYLAMFALTLIITLVTTACNKKEAHSPVVVPDNQKSSLQLLTESGYEIAKAAKLLKNLRMFLENTSTKDLKAQLAAVKTVEYQLPRIKRLSDSGLKKLRLGQTKFEVGNPDETAKLKKTLNFTLQNAKNFLAETRLLNQASARLREATKDRLRRTMEDLQKGKETLKEIQKTPLLDQKDG